MAFLRRSGVLEFNKPPSAESRPVEEWDAMGSQDFIDKVYELVGRPFEAKKHSKAAPKQVHLGLLNDLSEFQNGKLSIHPREVGNFMNYGTP